MARVGSIPIRHRGAGRHSFGIYIASSWNNHRMIRLACEYVEYAGHFVHSSWIKDSLSGAKPSYDEGLKWSDPEVEADWSRRAKLDLKEIREADGVLVILDRSAGTGHHNEYGYALAQNKPIVLTGDEPWGVFHSLVPWRKTMDEAVRRLEGIVRQHRRMVSAGVSPSRAIPW